MSEHDVTNGDNNCPMMAKPTIPHQSRSSNIDFVYSDTDQHLNEIAELYSYSEEIDFMPNRISFEELMEDYGYPLKWIHMSELQQKLAIERMAEGIEFTDRNNRIRAIRGLLYLCQGNFGDCLVIDEQPRFARKNIFQLYDYGLFPTFIQLIHYEIEKATKTATPASNLISSTTANQNSTSTSNDPNVPLRLLVNIVYLFVQEMSYECSKSDTDYHQKLRQQFKEELMQPICGELFHITLFDMIVKHCNGEGPKNFPTKKTLLLLWKCLLLTLGDHNELLRLKNYYRKRAGLSPVPDDTIEVTKRMLPASPPPTAAEIIDSQHLRKMNRPFKRQTVVKQNSIGGGDETDLSSTNFVDDEIINDDAFEPPNNENGNNDNNSNNNNNNRIANGTNGHLPSTNTNNNNNDKDNTKTTKDSNNLDDSTSPATPRPGSPRSSSPVPEDFHPNNNNNRKNELENLRAALMINKSLPWQPKVRQKDIEFFFAQVRKKFVGFVLPDECTATAGLPKPILESIEVLKRHLYQSLSELQIKREEDLARYPLTMQEFDLEACNSFTEQLYRSMLPCLPQYLIALLKLLLGSVSNLKSKNESHNVLADIMPQKPPTSVIQSIKLKIDLNRHQEIIIKAISGIIILLLKHYKINHVYQFEYICQQLMFANCIPLIIKFLSQEMNEFVQSKNTIPVLDFPACVIGEQPELTSDSIELLTETQPYCWRNIFSSINLLRILNKLTKWKNCRIIMLVIFKSAQPLKRALRVRNAMFQLYVLKLLKIQAKFLGRQWRKNNMKTMSDIYIKVRHRLNDDWAFANDVDTKSIYVQTDEFMLQANINRFHLRRYEKPYPNNINSVTTQAFFNNNSGNTNFGVGGGITSNLNGVRVNEYISNSNNNSMSNQSSSVFDSNPTSQLFSSDNQQSSSTTGISSSLAAIVEQDLLQPIDNNLLSVLSKDISLPKEFKKNYEIWLEREVFQNKINWDELIVENHLSPSSTTLNKSLIRFILSSNSNNYNNNNNNHNHHHEEMEAGNTKTTKRNKDSSITV